MKGADREIFLQLFLGHFRYHLSEPEPLSWLEPLSRFVQDIVVCMAPLNYKTRILYKNERVVDSFRMTGLVAELALQKSKSVGVAALRSEHLPASMQVSLDGLGKREVQVLEENRTLAVTVA